MVWSLQNLFNNFSMIDSTYLTGLYSLSNSKSNVPLNFNYNNTSTSQDFNTFVNNAYEGIPESTSTVEDKRKAILAKIAILNHPDCPPETKSALTNEITTINNEISSMDQSVDYNKSFKEFVKELYAEIPSSTSSISDKQKVILAKVAIINHPDCPESSKLTLAKEIRILNSEIARIKENVNTNV